MYKPCKHGIRKKNTFSTDDCKRRCQGEGSHDGHVVVLQTVFTLCSSNPFVTLAVLHDMMLIVTSLKVKMSSGDVHPALSAARHSEWCSSHLPLKLTLTLICPSHCQLSQITLFHSFVSCVTCHGNKCVCMGSEDDTINSFGPAFCCQHTECDPWETAAASWPPESLLAQWGWHPVSWRWETDEATAVF